MKSTVTPHKEFNVIKEYIAKDISKKYSTRIFEEIIISPAERLGASGASFYTFYFRCKDQNDRPYFTTSYFCKIYKHGSKGYDPLLEENRNYTELVSGRMESATYPPHFNFGVCSIGEDSYSFLYSEYLGEQKLNSNKELASFKAITLENRLLELADDQKRFDKEINDLLNLTYGIMERWQEESSHSASFTWEEQYSWYLRKASSLPNLGQLLGDQKNFSHVLYLGKKIRNPLKFIEDLLITQQESKLRIVHGDLHPKNIMVASQYNIFIIDFGWTRDNSHYLKDYCLLEASLKFFLISKRLNDSEIFQFEDALNNQNDCPIPLRKEGGVESIFHIIKHVRNCSKKENEKSDEEWLKEYLTSLMLITVGYLGINSNELDTRAVFTSTLALAQKIDLLDLEFNLVSYGERKLLDDIFIDHFNKIIQRENYDDISLIGNDCSVLPINKNAEYYIYSSDPCPLPVSWMLGDLDFYHYGWYSLLINLSDVASMGARPKGMLLSCIMDNNMSIRDLNRFIEGVSDCSLQYKCPILGGNIKDGQSFDVHGTIIAESSSVPFNRSDSQVGDYIVVVGELGAFWTATLAIKELGDNYNEDKINYFWQCINKPVPKVEAGIILSEVVSEGHQISCIDNSDGLTGCFYELARKSKLNLILDERDIIDGVSSDTIYVSEKTNIDILKLALNWGDWQLVFSVSANGYDEFRKKVSLYNSNVSSEEEIKYHQLGTFIECKKEQDSLVFVKSVKNNRKILRDFENQRFSENSIFSHGLDSYIDYLRKLEILNDE